MAETLSQSITEIDKLNVESESDDEDNIEIVDPLTSTIPKKKKKKKSKKKKNNNNIINIDGTVTNSKFTPLSDMPNGIARGINYNFDKYSSQFNKQTVPPTIPISNIYPSHIYPEGEICTHPGQEDRLENAEKQRMELIYGDTLNEIREAAEVHRHTRAYVQRVVKPGMKMIDICQMIENSNKALLQNKGLERGWAFPTGCSLNHVAAHYTPNYGDETILTEKDVMKIDFGTHVNGHIIDSAFTMSFDPQYDELLAAVKESTNAGLKAAGVDVRLCDIGEIIQEVMESHEVTINGKVYPVKSIRNLNGHSIGTYNIHAGKSIPMVKNNDTTRMVEGEFYAIETFGSTGKGIVYEDMECSHYAKVYDCPPNVNLRSAKERELLNHIDKTFGTLAWCRRWLDDSGQSRYLLALKGLVDKDVVRAYPPLVDIKGSFTAQYEHTFLLRPTCKELLSRGDDY